MANHLQVVDSRKRQVLVNMDLVTRIVFGPEQEDQSKTRLYLYFDGDTSVLLIGDEARRMWGLLSEKGEWKFTPRSSF